MQKLLDLKFSNIEGREDLKLVTIVCNDYERLREIIENGTSKVILSRTGMGIDFIAILNHTEDDKIINIDNIEKLEALIEHINKTYCEPEKDLSIEEFKKLKFDDKLVEIYKKLLEIKAQ